MVFKHRSWFRMLKEEGNLLALMTLERNLVP